MVSRRLVTVTLNPALDRLYSIPGFGLNGVFCPDSLEIHAGGKGINVARVWTLLGGSAAATGFLGGRTGDAIAKHLADELIENRFLPIAEESRQAMSLFNPESGSEAIVNEVGPLVDTLESDPFLDHLSGVLPGAKFLAISGSAPPGVSVNLYSEMIERARSLGIKTAVDASGAALIEAVKARPFLIKPNRAEAAALGAKINSWDDAASAARDLSQRYGIDIVVITGGPDGGVVACESGVWSVTPPQVDIVSTLGCGDSTLAGFLWSYGEDSDCARALSLGIACGVANTQTIGAGCFDPARIAEFSGKIKVTKQAVYK